MLSQQPEATEVYRYGEDLVIIQTGFKSTGNGGGGHGWTDRTEYSYIPLQLLLMRDEKGNFEAEI